MIVVLTEVEELHTIYPGCTFELIVDGKPVIKETTTREYTIDYAASFVFTNADCSRSGNTAGIFGRKNELPEEIISAKRVVDLTEEQQLNLAKSGLVELERC